MPSTPNIVEPAPSKPLPPTPPEKTAEELEAGRVTVLKKKFEGVNRAAIAIASAVEVGVTYQQFGPLNQQLATEIALLRQASPDKAESAALALFDQAVSAYRDAGNFWEASIRFYSRRDNQG